MEDRRTCEESVDASPAIGNMSKSDTFHEQGVVFSSLSRALGVRRRSKAASLAIVMRRIGNIARLEGSDLSFGWETESV